MGRGGGGEEGEGGSGERLEESLKSDSASTGWWIPSSTVLPCGIFTSCSTANYRRERKTLSIN